MAVNLVPNIESEVTLAERNNSVFVTHSGFDQFVAGVHACTNCSEAETPPLGLVKVPSNTSVRLSSDRPALSARATHHVQLSVMCNGDADFNMSFEYRTTKGRSYVLVLDAYADADTAVNVAPLSVTTNPVVYGWVPEPYDTTWYIPFSSITVKTRVSVVPATST